MSEIRSAIAKIKELSSRRPVMAGIIAAFLGMIFSAGYLQQREQKLLKIAEPVQVIVAAADVIEGDVLDEGNIKSFSVPRRFREPGAFESINEVIGKIAVVPIKKGAQITRSIVRGVGEARGLSAIVPAGRRAITIDTTDLSGVVELLRPGDSVDVIATLDVGMDSQKQRITLAVVEDAEVLSVGSKILGDLPDKKQKPKKGLFEGGPSISSSGRQTAMTLAVLPDDVQKIAFVEESGAISISLRPFLDDSGEERPKPTTIQSIVGGYDGVVPMRNKFREYRGR